MSDFFKDLYSINIIKSQEKCPKEISCSSEQNSNL